MKTHDLDELLAEIRQVYGSLPEIHVSWASDEADPAYFDRRWDWGCCTHILDVYMIGLSRDLQRAPRYVVKAVLWHEVLHVLLPKRGRCFHHKAFRVAEKMIPHYERAEAWLTAWVASH